MGQVYVITCLPTLKQYVGMTRHTHQWRWLGHVEAARNGSRQRLHRAIRRHGCNSFAIEVVYTSSSVNALFKKEAEWIYKLDTYENGYNMTRGNSASTKYRRSALALAKRRIRKRLAKIRRRGKRYGVRVRRHK